MKISLWDILSVLLLLATAIVLLVVINIYSNPNGGLNPFPPPTLPSVLILPTYTNTPLQMPPTWTPKPGDNSGGSNQPEATQAGLRPTWTLLPTPTGFQVATWTPTFTLTYTPTNTLTPTRTPTITPIPPTATPNQTATYRVLATQIAAGKTGTAAVGTANAVAATQTAVAAGETAAAATQAAAAATQTAAAAPTATVP